jgi:diguanylate cyclase (GGDEF)-like protein
MQNGKLGITINDSKSFELLFSKIPVGVIVIDGNGALVSANDYVFENFKKPIEMVEGSLFGNTFNCGNAVGEQVNCGEGIACKQCKFRKAIGKIILQQQEIKEEEICQTVQSNGRTTEKWFSLYGSPVNSEGKELALIALTDITRKKSNEKILYKLGVTDALTGLYNRRFIKENFINLINNNNGNNLPATMIMLDIDKFKVINDTYGHPTGDEVLIKLSEIFIKNTRENDYVGRYGGEEFLLLLGDTTIEQSKVVTSRIAAEFETCMCDVFEKKLTFSGGCVEITNHDINNSEFEKVIDKADKLLYKAKANGRNRIES